MAADENQELMIGSASWTGVDGYTVDSVQYKRATAFLATVKWDMLESLASALRNGTPCKFLEKFSIGSVNMVRRIIFDDGISWIARLRMPEIKETYSGHEVAGLRTEIACMNFLKQKTSIPVPEIYTYNDDPDNFAGAGYILMSYLHGTTAFELQLMKNCEEGLYGTSDQDRRFREQMARIQVELSSFKFSHIGSLYKNEETSEFFIGPEVETGKGPWATPIEYYNDFINHSFKKCMDCAKEKVKESISFAIPLLFKYLISVYGQNCDMEGSFALTNRDFGAHNLLVNDEFEIIGVIDFEGIMAAPIEEVAQYPRLTGLDRAPPGHTETRPLAINRIEKTEKKLEDYRDIIRKAEISLGGSNNGEGSIANVMLSDAAGICQGLMIEYPCVIKCVNDRWMEAYVRLLLKHLPNSGEAPIADVKSEAERIFRELVTEYSHQECVQDCWKEEFINLLNEGLQDS